MREPIGLVKDCCVFDSATNVMLGVKIDGIWYDSPNLAIKHIKEQLGVTAREARERHIANTGCDAPSFSL